MRYADALAVLDRLVNYEKQAKPRDEFKLDTIRGLLHERGDPQLRCGRTVLVAGTKGKGSVCYLLDAALRSCGCRTGMFVSPHVRSVRERIQLDGAPVSRRAFAAAVARQRPSLRRHPVSYFELTAALAFETFARKRVEYAVVEVGLGGRLDATNLAHPEVSVISRIGLDHTLVLGRTIGLIAREKAGIMRPGRPVVVSKQTPQSAAALRHRARSVGADLWAVEEHCRIWDARADGLGVSFSFLGELGAGRVRLGLLGQHQIENAATALTVLGLLARNDHRIRFEPVRAGLAAAAVPARCQLVGGDPMVIIDSCHNPDSGQALADVIRDHVGHRVLLVYGSLRGKRIRSTVAPLVGWVQEAVLTQPDSPRAVSTSRLGRILDGLGFTCSQQPVAAQAFEQALVQARTAGLPLVIGGSFYLAGEALDWLERHRAPSAAA